MNIQEIKAVANITGTLALVRQFAQQPSDAPADAAPIPTEWVSHWDNEKRVRVTMHQDVMATIKSNPSFAGLALKTELVPQVGERLAYTRHVVITPNNIEATF
jgi:hypothetical protein